MYKILLLRVKMKDSDQLSVWLLCPRMSGELATTMQVPVSLYENNNIVDEKNI